MNDSGMIIIHHGSQIKETGTVLSRSQEQVPILFDCIKVLTWHYFLLKIHKYRVNVLIYKKFIVILLFPA